MDYFSLCIWLILAALFWGLPTYLYGKGKITFIDRPLSHSAWFLLGIVVTILIFKTNFFIYFSGISTAFVVLFAAVSLAWLLSPYVYPHEHLSRLERAKYQPTKFLEILLQQVLFLAGLLILGENWILFGLLFFAVHLPFLFFLPFRIISVTASFSLPGGLLFAFLQSIGPFGFLASLSLHLLFYAGFHIVMVSGYFPNFKPYRR